MPIRINFSHLSWQHLSASFFVGVSVGFFSYVLCLQTSVFSRRYLFLGIGIAIAGSLIAYFLLSQHPFAFKNKYFINRRSCLLAGLLFILALPSYFLLPPYPKLPFFQRESTLTITIKTETEPVFWSQFRRIYLNSGVAKLGFRGFQISDAWIPAGDDFILQPGSTGQIRWNGHVGQRASLSLPIPSPALSIVTTWDGDIRQVSADKSPYVQNKNFTPPLWYAILIYAIAWIPLFFVFVMLDGFPRARWFILPAWILSLSFLQVQLQFRMLELEFHGPLQEVIKTVQLARHFTILNGSAPNPWQYRVFSEWLLELFLYISAGLLKLDYAVPVALWSLRILQNLILLTLAYVYFMKLGITKTVSTYGVFLLAGGMLHVFYQSDLSFNTYFDVIFFLLAGILILEGKYIWIPALMIIASLNRETSIMIPVLLIAWGWRKETGSPAKALLSGGIALLIWIVIFVALRLYYPNAPMFRLGDDLLPGWDLFRYNLSVPEMPVLLFQTLGFLPLAGILVQKYWHPFVRLCFLLLVPVWLLVHAFSSVWAETRLFLVLFAMVLIPAFLPFIHRRFQEIRQYAL